MIKYLLFTSLFLFSCSSVQEKSKIETVFNNNIEVIEDFIGAEKDSIDSKKLRESIAFLEQLTQLECDTNESYLPVDEPSSNNLIEWKEWYRQNHYLLYWDNIDNEIKKKD